MNSAACRRRLPAAALVVLLAAAAPPGDTSVEAIAGAAGHPAHVRLHGEATVVRDGQAESATLDVRGMLRLERTCFERVCGGSWFDGNRLFTFGINGMPLPEEAGDERAARTFAAIASTAFAEPPFGRAGGRIEILGAGRYGVTAPDGAELIAVTDTHTRRITSVERPDGRPYAALEASGGPPPLLYAQRHYERVTTSSEAFDVPHGPIVTFEGPPADLPLLTDLLPIVPCRAGGLPARCLIDSGTTPSAITLDLTERLGREPHGVLEIHGLRTYLTGIVDGVPVAIGTAKLPGLNLAVVPPPSGADFDIIIGADVLARLRVELEPGRRRARVDGGETSADAPQFTVEFHGGVPLTDVRFAGRSAERALVDTGDTGTISIGYAAYHDDPGLFAPRERGRAYGAGAAVAEGVGGELAWAAVGAGRFEQLPIVAVRGQVQPHLGYGFAARCRRFTLDLGRRRVGCAAAGDARAGEH